MILDPLAQDLKYAVAHFLPFSALPRSKLLRDSSANYPQFSSLNSSVRRSSCGQKPETYLQIYAAIYSNDNPRQLLLCGISR